MSFSSQQAIRCLGNQFRYCLLIGCIEIAALKRQQFEDDKSDVMELRISKRLCVDTHDNEEGQGLDKY